MNMIAEFILIDDLFIPYARIDSIRYLSNLTDEENGHPETKFDNRLVIEYHSGDLSRTDHVMTIVGAYADKLYNYLKVRSADVAEL
jgi:hypothetical protein